MTQLDISRDEQTPLLFSKRERLGQRHLGNGDIDSQDEGGSWSNLKREQTLGQRDSAPAACFFFLHLGYNNAKVQMADAETEKRRIVESHDLARFRISW
jgi:hypothetical protein